MKFHPHRKLLGGLVLSSALLLSACGASGGSDASDKKDESTTTAKEKVTTTTEDPSKEAQTRADSIDLKVSDLPDGWSANKPEPDDPDNPLKKCDPSFADESAELAKHSSDDFTIGSLDDGDGAQYSVDSKVFADEAAAKEALKPFNDTEVIQCVDDALKTSFGDGDTNTVSGSLSDDDLDKSEIGADDSEGISASYDISSSDGTKITANVAILLVRNGDILSMNSILWVGDSFDITTMLPVIQKVSDLQKAA